MSVFDAFARLDALRQQRPQPSPPSWLVVGLGNPDKKYDRTRHNTGFICLDEIAKELETPIIRNKFDAMTAEAMIAGQRVLLMKPQTYMNLSGTSVEKAASFYKFRPSRLSLFSMISRWMLDGCGCDARAATADITGFGISLIIFRRTNFPGLRSASVQSPILTIIWQTGCCRLIPKMR